MGAAAPSFRSWLVSVMANAGAALTAIREAMATMRMTVSIPDPSAIVARRGQTLVSSDDPHTVPIKTGGNPHGPQHRRGRDQRPQVLHRRAGRPEARRERDLHPQPARRRLRSEE